MDISQLRQEYLLRGLSSKDLNASPFTQFLQWFEESVKAGIREANAFSLATSTLEGTPSCRLVLMKGFDSSGLLFFSNIYSCKSRQLAINPQAAAVFWWKELERQVLIRGRVERLTAAAASGYFSKRPRKSQLGARASRQSEAIPCRDFLKKEYKRLDALYKNCQVPVPQDWGGFKIIPHYFEFWQGRASRLHDRFCYTPLADAWEIKRLSP